MTLGKRIKKLRRQRGWSVEVLAANAGITRKTLQEIENGVRAGPRLDTLQLIAKALHIELYKLFKEEEEYELIGIGD